MRDKPAPIATGAIGAGFGDEHDDSVVHLAPELFELSFVRAGHMIYSVGNKQYVGEAGDLLLLHSSPSRLVQARAGPPIAQARTMWAHFRPRPHWNAWLDWPVVLPGIMKLRPPDGPAGWRVVRRLSHACRFGKLAIGTPLFQDKLFHHCEAVLIACRQINPQDAVAQMDPRIQRVCEFIISSSAKPISLRALAEIACLSPDRFEKLFLRETGSLPFRYIEQLRMLRAENILLRTNRPVSDISREVGISDPAYFARRFRLFFGTGPREYRASHAEVFGRKRRSSPGAQKRGR